MAWRSINATPERPRHWDDSSRGFYYYDIVGTFTGEPIGWRKLKRIRTLGERRGACEEFAKLVDMQLPDGASWTYMPSSTRHHCGIDSTSIEATFRSALTSLRADVRFVEPLVRASPVESVHESRDRNVQRLASTLAPVDAEVAVDGLLFVVDNFINTGATFAAFRLALRRHAIAVETTLLALVYTGNSKRVR